MTQLDINELIARGKIKGAYMMSGYGSRETAGPESDFAIWPNGVFSIPAASGVQMTIASTSVDDTLLGTGARTLELHYLDGLLNPQAEIIEMSGTSDVLTAAEDIRFIQCLHLHTVGAGAKAAGDITAIHNATTYSQISTGKVRCSSSFRMVPAGKTLTILAAVGSSISGTSAARSELSLAANYLDQHQYNDPLMLMPMSTIGLQDNAMGMNFPPNPGFPEGTVVGAIHTSDKACIVSNTWFGRIENKP